MGIGLRAVLREVLGQSLSYLTFFPGVVFSALYGGLGPALLSILLSVGAVVFLSKPPFYRAGGAASSDAIVAGTFVLLALCICLMGAALRRSRAASEQRLRELTLEISRRREAEQTMRQQWENFDSALSHSADFIYMFDLQGRFTYANRSLLLLYERSLSEVVGRNFFQLDFPKDLAERLQRQVQQVIDTREPLRDQTPYTSPSGETRQYEYIFTPVLGVNDRVEAVIGSTRDTTERTQSEEALRKSEERLTLALEAGGGAGVWDWNINSGLIFCNSQLGKLYSFNPASNSEGLPLERFLEHVHPDDRDRVEENMRKAVTRGGEFMEEYRGIQKDGSVRWLTARGRCHIDDSGNCVRFPGVVFDITASKQAEQNLRESQERLSAIYHGTYEYIGLITPDGNTLEANQASLEFAGSTREEIIGIPFWNCPWFAGTPGARDMIRDAVMRSAQGEFLRFEATCAPSLR